MVTSYGIRPRSGGEQLKMAAVLAKAPAVVAVEGDDGWAAACLALGGHSVVLGAGSDAPRVERTLRRLGLPRPIRGLAAATLTSDLTLKGDAEPGVTKSATVEGPLVSILICTFNRVHLVGEAIASAKAQSWPCEIIVVDDGSTDGTAELLARTPGIKVLSQPNRGKPHALAAAIGSAEGEALLVLDDDDLLLPGAVRALAHALFGAPELAAVWADTIVFDDATRLPVKYAPAATTPAEMAHIVALQRLPAMPGACLVRRTAQDAAGAYDERLIRGQDIDMFVRLAAVGPIGTVPFPTFLHRAHPGARGTSADQWDKSDAILHGEKFRSFVRPVLAERHAAATITDRAKAFAWVVGLHQAGATEEAILEAERWPAPYTASERWARDLVGLPSFGGGYSEAVLVVDDGDPGALEATLARHSEGRAIWVNLEVPRDPLVGVRLHWEGRYAARERLHRWCAFDGPVHLRLSSDPRWAPPPIHGTVQLPDLPAVDAVVALAAALDWPLPARPRATVARVLHPVARGMVQARLALRKGQPRYAVNPLSNVLKLAPDWRLGWKLAGGVFASLGYTAEADSCRRQAG